MVVALRETTSNKFKADLRKTVTIMKKGNQKSNKYYFNKIQ
jgi:hypothetical protein